MIARERPLCDCPGWSNFRMNRSRKATTVVSPGWTGDMRSYRSGRFGTLRGREATPRSDGSRDARYG